MTNSASVFQRTNAYTHALAREQYVQGVC